MFSEGDSASAGEDVILTDRRLFNKKKKSLTLRGKGGLQFPWQPAEAAADGARGPTDSETLNTANILREPS